MLDLSDGDESVLDELITDRWLLFLSVEPLLCFLEVFVGGEQLAGEVADLLSKPHGVVWLSCVLLPLELSDLGLQSLLDASDLFLLPLAPDEIEVHKELIDQLLRQVVAVLQPELVAHIDSLAGNELIWQVVLVWLSLAGWEAVLVEVL